MLDYCPPNSTLSGLGFHNINRCFLDTITDPFILFVSLVFGVHQLRLYKRYSTPIPPENIGKSCLYHAQVFLNLLVPVLSLFRFFILLYGYNESVFGIEILNLLTSCLSWPLIGWLVGLERNRQLPVSARNGHGPVLLIFWTFAFMQVNIRLASITHEPWWEKLSQKDLLAVLDLTHYVTVYVTILLVILLGIKAPGLVQPYQYNTMSPGCQAGAGLLPGEAQGRSPWTNMLSKIKKLLPYIWPVKSILLQIRVVFCILLLTGVRVTNLFVPILYKYIVDALVETELRPSSWPWKYVTVWAVLRLLQGGGTGSSGLLNNWRSLLWIRVQQYTTLEIQTMLLAHVHNLSLRWHLGRKTGELTRIMDRGTSAVNNLLQYLVFNILPTLVDIMIAIIYFCLQFNVYFGLIVMITMVLYLIVTFAITEWRTKFRREMNELDNKQRARGVDSLLNAETVKYYSMEDYEVQRYKELIQDCQEMEWKSMASLQFLNLVQSLIINNGLFGVSLYCAYLVTSKELTVGDFALVGTYFMQLMGPLNFIGTVYRMIQESFINMENMFDLLDEKIEVQDKPDAVTYKQNNHPPEIRFDNVSFHYTEARPILEKLSFVIPPGSSVAVVGASGNGKSTLAKILFRLFDPVDGSVLINGRDIRDFTQKSYRGNIGVVPQDTVLFNEDIIYNLSYGKIGATQQEIEDAARMADIQDTILDFPDGYKTVVGERGLKLSGGEKQRVAIARALIKNPNIIIFDEATSSLDTKTELHIQNAIEGASRQRTVLMIAHRLSTIMNCDQILVLDGGKIIEQGRHEDLLKLDGKYANLWNIQISAVNSKETPPQPEIPLTEHRFKTDSKKSLDKICNGSRNNICGTASISTDSLAKENGLESKTDDIKECAAEVNNCKDDNGIKDGSNHTKDNPTDTANETNIVEDDSINEDTKLLSNNTSTPLMKN